MAGFNLLTICRLDDRQYAVKKIQMRESLQSYSRIMREVNVYTFCEVHHDDCSFVLARQSGAGCKLKGNTLDAGGHAVQAAAPPRCPLFPGEMLLAAPEHASVVDSSHSTCPAKAALGSLEMTRGPKAMGAS